MTVRHTADAIRRTWLSRFLATYVASFGMLCGLVTCVYLFLFSDPMVTVIMFLPSPNHHVWAEVLSIQKGFVRPERHRELRLGGEDGFCPDHEHDADLVARWTDADVKLSWTTDSSLILEGGESGDEFKVLRTTYSPCPMTEAVWTGTTWKAKPIQRKPELVGVTFRTDKRESSSSIKTGP